MQPLAAPPFVDPRPAAPILRGPSSVPAVTRAGGSVPGARTSPTREQQDAWVVRLRAGDGAALAEVVAAFSERLTNVVSAFLRDRDAVDDVVEETFVKAFYRIGSFSGESGLYTWLYRVAVNLAKDHVKRFRRRPAIALEDLGPERSAIPARDVPALESVEGRERREAVRDAIAALPPKFRAAIVLREVEGLRYEQIAEILGVSQGTVESRLFRARRRLSALLSRWEPRS